MIYNRLAAGGTFDHFHKGHQQFLLFIFEHAKNVVIGITSDSFASEYKNTSLQQFSERKQAVENFLNENGLLERAQVIEIDDVYGPLLQEDFIVDAIGVTNDTYKGAEAINNSRAKKGLKILSIVMMHISTNMEEKISSSSIRAGIIDTAGKKWVKEEWRQNSFMLPENLREELKKPFGKILQKLPIFIDSENTITVGDVTTQLFLQQATQPKVAIIDFVVERKPTYTSVEDLGFVENEKVIRLKNPSGHIAPDAWNMIGNACISEEKKVILVEGEEDLLVLVCILVAPLNTYIYYGQPHVGLVEIEVDLAAKEHAYLIMDQFVRAKL